MQQPLPSPDERSPETDTPDEELEFIEADPGVRLTPEQVAERSALEVFPGAEETIEADQPWLQERDEPADDRPPSEHPSEIAHESFGEPSTPLTPSQLFPTAERRGETPEQRMPRSPSTSAGEPPAVNVPAVERRQPDDFSRRAMAMPLLGGRERREAAGASQRAAILAQAGTPLDEEELDDSPAVRAAPMGADSPAGGHSAARTAPSSERSLTRKIALSLFVSALALLVLSGGAIVSGEGGGIERVASALAPDSVERWVSERVSSFGTSAVTPEADSPLGDTASRQPDSLLGQIANTGGAGVAVRTVCVPEARATRTIPEGTRVTVIARGVGDCSGWNMVRAGASVSWVEASHIEPVQQP